MQSGRVFDHILQLTLLFRFVCVYLHMFSVLIKPIYGKCYESSNPPLIPLKLLYNPYGGGHQRGSPLSSIHLTN